MERPEKRRGRPPEERGAALAEGKEHYWTGKPCVNGHISLRATLIGDCLECRRATKQRERRIFTAAKT